MKEDDRFKKIFCNNLKYWTRNNFKTQADIVKDLQIPCSTVNDWYKGKNYPRIATIKKLADYFGIQIIDLIEEKINLKNIEEEIKVGEYVRFRSGKIDKVTHIEKNANKMWFENTSGEKTMISIVRHSFNILDLIKVGDYVNGIKIISIIQQADTMKTISLCGFDNDYLDIKLNNRDIETVVTKEQFENIEYKVEEQ
jgi:transcriptional regulator with XRE-family HTH domain